MLKNLIPRIKAAFTMHPEEIFGRLLFKSGKMTSLAAKYTVLGELHRSEPNRLSRLMCEIEEKFTLATGKSPPDYADKKILEVGCGVRGGVGPLSTLRGSASYLGVDPGVVPNIFADINIRRRYLQPALSDVDIRGKHIKSKEIQLSDFDNCCTYTQSTLEELELDVTPYDLSVSISCLEHISDLDNALSSLKRIMSPEGQHFHLVNFSNHLNKAKPFSGIYEMTPDVYWKKHGRHINLLRPSDYKQAFKKIGCHVDIIPMDIRADAIPKNTIDSWWLENYNVEELAIRTAVISNII
jgi:SAM-dependent methyltransferase